ncbi:hypothetical protein [Sabulibacter ruber]|uniref:hypothetical protein n=1 Tax=Sabulibacter ruber TaxID=2811901 RepID=UPI001A9642C9|nr:hypothetical protein [Sabulibacter ruber]
MKKQYAHKQRTQMSAEILASTPPSGYYAERHFGEAFVSPLWVKFTDNDYEEWVGCFSRQNEPLDAVLTDTVNETSLVVAGGKGVLVDVHTKEVVSELENVPLITSAIHTIHPEYFLIGTSDCIYSIDSGRNIKSIKPDFWVDGIYFTEQKGDCAIGHLSSYEYHQDVNVGFELDLRTNEITIDTTIKIRRFGLFELIHVTKKDAKVSEGLFTRLLRRFIRS